MHCENCFQEHTGNYGSGRFCSITCARSFATKIKRKEINEKVSTKLSGRKLSSSHKNNIEKSTNFNRKKRELRTCLECKINMSCLPSDKRKFCSLQCWVINTEKNKKDFELYKKKCQFDFHVNKFPEKFDLNLITEYGWYKAKNRGNNLNGISRDHMLSVRDGFILNIPPEIIKHPANCKLLPHKENQKKRTKSSITYEELLNRIENW